KEYEHKYLALYYALREAIIVGALPAGEKLPSSRELAEAYGLSRGTVNSTYDLLAGEGYVSGETGRGTYVCYAPPGRVAKGGGRRGAQPRLSAWGMRLAQLAWPREQAREGFGWTVDFTTVRPDAAAFPAAEWLRAVYAAARESAALGIGAAAHDA